MGTTSRTRAKVYAARTKVKTSAEVRAVPAVGSFTGFAVGAYSARIPSGFEANQV
ncbi:MAG TPA: hypothetical protein VI320_25375 [Terracidiphilus sp.]